jgi:hypothetical protein
VTALPVEPLCDDLVIRPDLPVGPLAELLDATWDFDSEEPLLALATWLDSQGDSRGQPIRWSLHRDAGCDGETHTLCNTLLTDWWARHGRAWLALPTDLPVAWEGGRLWAWVDTARTNADCLIPALPWVRAIQMVAGGREWFLQVMLPNLRAVRLHDLRPDEAETLTSLCPGSRLRSLELAGRRGVHSVTLSGAPHLHTLTLAYLGGVEVRLTGLPALARVDCTGFRVGDRSWIGHAGHTKRQGWQRLPPTLLALPLSFRRRDNCREGQPELQLEDLPCLRELVLPEVLRSRALDLVNLPALEELTLSARPALTHLRLDDLPGLEGLQIRDAAGLTDFHWRGTPALERLELDSLGDTRFTLPPVTALRHLTLSRCAAVGPGELAELAHARDLETLRVRDMPHFHLGEFGPRTWPRLRSLHLAGTCDWELLAEDHAALADVLIYGVKSLRRLSLQRLPGLRVLDISGATLQDVCLEELPALEVLTLADLVPAVSSITLGPFPALRRCRLALPLARELTLRLPPRVESITLVGCANLASLTLEGVSSIGRLWLQTPELITLRAPDLARVDELYQEMELHLLVTRVLHPRAARTDLLTAWNDE